MDCDGFGHSLAAGEPGADELVGVGAVGLGAGRADRGAAVSAGQVDDLVRGVLGVQRAEDLAGAGVDVADGAAQPDGPDASAGVRARAEPGVVVVAAGACEQFVVECPGARPGPRTVIGEHGGQGQRRDSHPRLPAMRESARWQRRGKRSARREQSPHDAPLPCPPVFHPCSHAERDNGGLPQRRGWRG